MLVEDFYRGDKFFLFHMFKVKKYRYTLNDKIVCSTFYEYLNLQIYLLTRIFLTAY